MPYPCLGEEATFASCLEDTDGEINVLAKSHLGKTAKTLIDITTNAHIERAGIELVEFLLASTDTASGEEARH